MVFEETLFEGVLLIKPTVYEDHRGLFFESFQQEKFQENGIRLNFVQDNCSISHANVLRGMHLQIDPFAQGKLVSVPYGSVYDVIVDVRPNSSTFLQHKGFEINSINKHILWIPPGFAHGFLSLEDQTVFSYKCTELYNRNSERIIRWNDPELAIEWPLKNPVLAKKDAEAPLLNDFLKELL